MPKFRRATPPNSEVISAPLLHFKIQPSTDHRAKFYAGRPTHLGDLALKEIKNKTSGLKIKSAPQAIVSGRTNNHVNICL